MGLVEQGPPWTATRALVAGDRAPERADHRDVLPSRLGGCLSLGGIMSSECNASAYE